MCVVALAREEVALGRGWCLNGAGPAGWLRESGSRLPHSKAFGWLVRRGCWRAHWVRRESCDSDRVEVLANPVGPAMMESVQT